MYKVYSFGFFILLCGVMLASAQLPRCFRFTWLGPQYNNQSVFMNATCQDATRLSGGVPCEQPLVVSYDGSRPNLNYIWTNHGQQASCLLADTDVCASYTYFFNGDVLNSTHMCTRAVESTGVAVRSGCFQDTNGSSMTRVCLCRTSPGAMPCNNANYSKSSTLTVFLVSLIIILYENLLVREKT